MNKYANTEKDIHKRIYALILGCFRDVVRKIPKTTENIPIIGQLASSLTSMGANDQEADAANSRRDFIAKYVIVKKETKETIYWISFVKDAELLKDPNLTMYIQEANEILKIVSKIISNTKLD